MFGVGLLIFSSFSPSSHPFKATWSSKGKPRNMLAFVVFGNWCGPCESEVVAFVSMPTGGLDGWHKLHIGASRWSLVRSRMLCDAWCSSVSWAFLGMTTCPCLLPQVHLNRLPLLFGSKLQILIKGRGNSQEACICHFSWLKDLRVLLKQYNST